MDYKHLWDRWVALTVLTEEDRKDLIERLHGDVTGVITGLSGMASERIGTILESEKYPSAQEYIIAVAPVLALGALDGYFLCLMERGIDPLRTDLVGQVHTEGLSEKWSKGHKKDQNRSYIDSIDPIVSLMLEKIYLLRVNQTLSFHPAIVDLPYKVTEKLHQYIGWCVYQGYVVGVLEQGK